MDRDRDRAGIWAPSIALICCGGITLWLVLAGTGITGAGAFGASARLLTVGLAVVAIALFWWTRRRV